MRIKGELTRPSTGTMVSLTQFQRASRRVIRQFWFLTGHDMRDEARREILKKPKGGRTYFIRVGKTGRRIRHIASAPFETHANITGQTRASIGFKIHGKDRMSFGYGVATAKPTTAWSGFLEEGTIGFKKVGPMAARPSLSAAIDKMEGRAQRNFDEAIRTEFKF